jgi:hypothetical protein
MSKLNLSKWIYMIIIYLKPYYNHNHHPTQGTSVIIMAMPYPKQPDFAAVGPGHFFIYHRVQSCAATQLTEPPLRWIQNRNLQPITHVDIVQRLEIYISNIFTVFMR